MYATQMIKKELNKWNRVSALENAIYVLCSFSFYWKFILFSYCDSGTISSSSKIWPKGWKNHLTYKVQNFSKRLGFIVGAIRYFEIWESLDKITIQTAVIKVCHIGLKIYWFIHKNVYCNDLNYFCSYFGWRHKNYLF